MPTVAQANVVDEYLNAASVGIYLTANTESSCHPADSLIPSRDPSLNKNNNNNRWAVLPARTDARTPDRAWFIARMAQWSSSRSRHYAGRLPLVETGLLLLSAGLVAVTAVIRKKYRELKRYFDVIGSILILSLFSPLMIMIALLIKIDSPGPVLIKQVRVGLNRRRRKTSNDSSSERRKSRNYGSLFMLYKFRTMYADAEAKTGPVWARKDDDRVTRIGKILRRTHLDELPQFVNVLKGDMCIIGPRPERPVFTEQLNCHIRNFAKRLQVKPGITGLAQVRYRYAASIADTKKKLKYDLLYIKKMCISMDARILLNTFNLLVMTDKGAR